MDLKQLADDLEVSDRTLRRAALKGTIHDWRRGPKGRVEVPVQELLYLERSWPLLDALVSELRTLPNVRLAVLFGSRARGDDRADSDLDVFVRLAESSLRARGQLVARLETALPQQRVQIVEAEDANSLLLSDVIRDGRVLVDRDDEWQRLRRRRRQIEGEAQTQRLALEHEVFAGLDALFAEAGV